MFRENDFHINFQGKFFLCRNLHEKFVHEILTFHVVNL